MATVRLLLRLPVSANPNTEQTASWWVGDAQNNELYSGTLAELGQQLHSGEIPRSAKTLVVLPAAEVLLTQAIVPAVSKKQLQQLLPFAVEEQLLESIESQHFSLGEGKKQGDGQLAQAVAIITQDRMQQRLEQLQRYGIQADTLISEAFCLPADTRHWTLLLEPGRPALLRYGVWAQTIETDNLTDVLTLVLAAQKEHLPESCTVYDFRSQESSALETTVTTLLENHGIAHDWQAYTGDPLSLFAAELEKQHSINLRQGMFSRQQQLSRLWKPWRFSVALAALMLIILPLSLTLEHNEKKQHLKQLSQQMTDIFKTTFPDAKRIVNPRAQMENRLKAMKKSSRVAQGNFLHILASASPGLEQTKGLQLDTLRFKSNKLTLNVQIDSFEKLDTLKKELIHTGLSVEIQSATANKNKVKAQLILSEAAS